MKNIDHNDLFRHVSGYLESKGVQLQDGDYARRLREGCRVLAGIANRTQSTVDTVRIKVDDGVDRLRQFVHEKTAPRPASSAGAPAAGPETRGGPTSGATDSAPKKKRPAPAARAVPPEAASRKPVRRATGKRKSGQ